MNSDRTDKLPYIDSVGRMVIDGAIASPTAEEPSRIRTEIESRAYARLGRLLSDEELQFLKDLYPRERPFRSRVVMSRHGFGEGEYKYFDYPLPDFIHTLRERLYALLLPIANQWQDKMRTGQRFPDTLGEMLARCHADGQTRPTPLILKYGEGGFNCLHQDLYGTHAFPFQVVVLLSESADFDGGEFVLTEQRPRMQSRVEVVPMKTGHGVAFAVNERPKKGTRGYYRVKHRHGVSPIRKGERFTLGIIFHDAA